MTLDPGSDVPLARTLSGDTPLPAWCAARSPGAPAILGLGAARFAPRAARCEAAAFAPGTLGIGRQLRFEFPWACLGRVRNPGGSTP